MVRKKEGEIIALTALSRQNAGSSPEVGFCLVGTERRQRAGAAGTGGCTQAVGALKELFCLLL